MDKIPDIFRHIAIAHVIKHGKIERYKTTFFRLSAVADLRGMFETYPVTRYNKISQKGGYDMSKKKLMALLLSGVMTATTVSVPVFAEDADAAEDTADAAEETE